MPQKNEKMFFPVEIIASELVALNSLYYKEYTFQRKSVC